MTSYIQEEETTGTPAFVLKQLTREEFTSYLREYHFGMVPPGFLVLHHTYRPTVASWKGRTTLRGIQRYYKSLGWDAGPHIFCAPDGIWLATPMSRVGIHANSGNSGDKNGLFTYSLGIEMVGDYDKEFPSGEVWEHTIHVLGSLIQRLSLQTSDIRFHREYNAEKSCPGKAVQKEEVDRRVNQWLENHPVLPELQPLTVSHAARCSEQTFVNVLELQQSPTRSLARTLYRICLSEGIDPAVALAFFAHESSYGKAGLCALHDLKNWGNVRRPEDPQLGSSVIIPERGPFTKYPSWENGLLDWCYRLRGPKYAGSGLFTVEDIIPKYAPSADNNKPEAYIRAVRQHVHSYMGNYTIWVTVTADTLNIRQGPSTNYLRVGQLQKGARLLVDSTKAEGQGEWLHLADGRGFIKREFTRNT